MLQRLIREEIALAHRMVRRIAGGAPGARASRDGADEELRRREPQGQEWDHREQHGRRKTARLSGMRRFE